MYFFVYCFHSNLVLCYYYFSCVLKILFSYPRIMNCTQKLYNKIYLNDVLALILFFFICCILWCYYFSWNVLFMHKYVYFVIWSKILFLQGSLWKLRYFVTQLKQTNLENWFHISTESPKEGFNDTVFQHFMDKLKY